MPPQVQVRRASSDELNLLIVNLAEGLRKKRPPVDLPPDSILYKYDFKKATDANE